MTTKELINQYVTAHADNRWMDASELETLLTEFAEKLKAKQVVAIKCEKKSPITGGEMQLMQEKSSVKFRGEEISFIKKFYHCVNSGQEFTDTELDNDNMWAIFRAYWERRGFEHFYDIDGYREEQEPASEQTLVNSAKSCKDLQEPTSPCDTCEGHGLPGTCASISSLGRCPLEYNREPASEDLEKESDIMATKLFKEFFPQDGDIITPNDFCKGLRLFAHHFVQWQREQMMKDAISGYIFGSRYFRQKNVSLTNLSEEQYDKLKDFEERVKVIIIKE